MTPSLNSHGIQEHPPGCLGYVLLPVAVIAILIVAAWLAYIDWRLERKSQ